MKFFEESRVDGLLTLFFLKEMESIPRILYRAKTKRDFNMFIKVLVIVKDVWLMHKTGALLQTLTHRDLYEEQLFTSFLSAFNSIVADTHGVLSAAVIGDTKFAFASRGDLLYILLVDPEVPSPYAAYVANFIAERYSLTAGSREFIGDISMYNDFDEVARLALRDSGILFLDDALNLYEKAKDVRAVCLVDVNENKPMILKIRRDIDEDLLRLFTNGFLRNTPARFLIAKKDRYYVISGTPRWPIALVMDILETRIVSARLKIMRPHMPEVVSAPMVEVKVLEDWRG